MSMNQINSLLIGRAAGSSFGVSDSNLGRLSLISYAIGNPFFAVVAARSMAAADGGPQPDDPLKQAVEEARTAAADADAAKYAAAGSQAAAEKSAVAAAGSQQAAAVSETNAKGSADSAQTSAGAATASAADAKKSADAAQQAAAGKNKGGSSAV